MDDQDAVLDLVLAELRPLPAVDDSAKARLLIAVAAERERDREQALRRRSTSSRFARRAMSAALLAALAVGTVYLPGYVRMRTGQPRSGAPEPSRPVAITANAPSPARLAGADASTGAETAPQQVQLVLRAPDASRVRVVGDFNGWDQAQAPMTRDPVSRLWSTTLSLRPGRHVYAFVVDDTIWMRDPRAPAAKDSDFGRPGSVLLVGRP